MRAWAYMLGGLLLWAAQFFGLYIIASVFLTSTLSRILTLALTVALLVIDAVLIRRTHKRWKEAAGNPLAHWMDGMALTSAALAFIAICWQGLPAVLV